MKSKKTSNFISYQKKYNKPKKSKNNRKSSNRYGIKSKTFSVYEGKSISFDSNLEREFFFKFSNNINVRSIIREPFSIKYINPDDGRVHKYTPDFLIIYWNGYMEVVEIKPKIQLIDPVVKVKAFFALRYCISKGLNYRFITEDDLKL